MAEKKLPEVEYELSVILYLQKCEEISKSGLLEMTLNHARHVFDTTPVIILNRLCHMLIIQSTR